MTGSFGNSKIFPPSKVANIDPLLGPSFGLQIDKPGNLIFSKLGWKPRFVNKAHS